jgi:hypothetical protein
MYTDKKRKVIYIITHKMVWWHTHCPTTTGSTPLFAKPTWVVDRCEHCDMNIKGQDWWNNCSYNSSQMRLFDNLI